MVNLVYACMVRIDNYESVLTHALQLLPLSPLFPFPPPTEDFAGTSVCPIPNHQIPLRAQRLHDQPAPLGESASASAAHGCPRRRADAK